jgi:hypothetical protein
MTLLLVRGAGPLRLLSASAARSLGGWRFSGLLGVGWLVAVLAGGRVELVPTRSGMAAASETAAARFLRRRWAGVLAGLCKAVFGGRLGPLHGGLETRDGSDPGWSGTLLGKAAGRGL